MFNLLKKEKEWLLGSVSPGKLNAAPRKAAAAHLATRHVALCSASTGLVQPCQGEEVRPGTWLEAAELKRSGLPQAGPGWGKAGPCPRWFSGTVPDLP